MMMLGVVVLILMACNVYGAETPYSVEITVQHVSPQPLVESYVLEVYPEWSPLGAKRFKDLVESGFYSNACFFRVIHGFMAQMGMPDDPKKSVPWGNFDDDKVSHPRSNTRGFVSYAMTGAPNSRSYQIFFNYGNNARLDQSKFLPFGKLKDDDINRLEKHVFVVGEGAPNGPGPSQDKIGKEGNVYLKKKFPKLSCVTSMKIISNLRSVPGNKKAQVAVDESKDEKILSSKDAENGILQDEKGGLETGDGSLWVIVFALGCFFLYVFCTKVSGDTAKLN